MKNIKYIYKGVLLIAFVVVILTACDDNEDATPIVTNVRVVAKDSTITGAEFGVPIAIQGKNLKDVRKVFFNDVEGIFSPPYVTDSNILLYVPSIAPTQVTNKITLVTASGKTTTADFKVYLPNPEVLYLANEFSEPGVVNAIYGNYFYLISDVRVGDEAVDFEVVNSNTIVFQMPDAVGEDNVTVVGEGGTTVSSFHLNETNGNMMDFDVPSTPWGDIICWGSADRITPANSDIEPLAGNYTRIKQTNLAPTGFQDNWVVSTCYMEWGLDAGPATDKMFRFEAYIVEAWSMGRYEITIGTPQGQFVYNWKPWDTETFREKGIQTDGWRTFVVPLELFKKGDLTIADASAIIDLKISFNNADSKKTIPSHHVALDNFRLTDK